MAAIALICVVVYVYDRITVVGVGAFAVVLEGVLRAIVSLRYAKREYDLC